MSSGKEGKDGKEGAIAKAAGIAVATGVVWGIFRFVKSRKAEDTLIQEYYGDREDFTISDAGKKNEEIDDVYVEEVVKNPPPPVPEGVKTEIREEIKVVEEPKARKPEPEVEEKPWFLSLFNPQKLKESKPKFQESETFEVKESKSESYEIKRGDTLWAISRKYGVSLDSLKATNSLHGDHIYTGDKLVIPPK